MATDRAQVYIFLCWRDLSQLQILREGSCTGQHWGMSGLNKPGCQEPSLQPCWWQRKSFSRKGECRTRWGSQELSFTWNCNHSIQPQWEGGKRRRHGKSSYPQPPGFPLTLDRSSICSWVNNKLLGPRLNQSWSLPSFPDSPIPSSPSHSGHLTPHQAGDSPRPHCRS